MQQQKEIIIVGGGMVGTACAVGLAKLGLQIHLIERSPLPHFATTCLTTCGFPPLALHQSIY